MTIAHTRLVHDDEGLNTGYWPATADHFITPVDLFFTRSHAPAPRIDPDTWCLEVDGLVNRPGAFSLADLGRAFPRREVAATLVCAGLRRDEFLALGPLPSELPWGPEPVSTGRWAGFALSDLLETVGVSSGARYVEFVGLDRVERHGQRFGFGGSIDLAKARSSEVLLATELNGAPLPVPHGFPLRTIVPGWIGARSVKWLGKIRLLDQPSSNYFQARAYRVQRQMTPGDPRDVSAGVAMSEVPVNAVILEPAAGQIVAAGDVRVRGWAMGSEGRPVARVELSADGGVAWAQARITAAEAAWTWALWEAELNLPPGPHTLTVRATDSAGRTQPASAKETWNVKGYGNNAWHRVAVRVAGRERSPSS